MPKGIYKRTPETLRKVIESAAMGRKAQMDRKGHMGLKKLPKEMRERLSKHAKTRTGAKNANWKGGICDDMKAWKRAYKQNNPERTRLDSKLRRARKKGAEGRHTLVEWEALKERYGHACPACGRPEPDIKLTEDHIVPLSKGGSNFIENIQPLCVNCNSRKHARTIKYEPICTER